MEEVSRRSFLKGSALAAAGAAGAAEDAAGVLEPEPQPARRLATQGPAFRSSIKWKKLNPLPSFLRLMYSCLLYTSPSPRDA